MDTLPRICVLHLVDYQFSLPGVGRFDMGELEECGVGDLRAALF
ncbi:MAG: hypothetical protein ACOCXC_04280 [Fibrobacterota bacterium]